MKARVPGRASHPARSRAGYDRWACGRDLVDLEAVAADLDSFFEIDTFQPDSPFSGLVPSVYGGTGIDLDVHLEGTFLKRFHGLMLRNSSAVLRIYTVVFLSNEIVRKVSARGVQDVLLISHHPLVMETSNRGFLPLSEVSFATMREKGISVYVLHTPLDVHGKVSTSGALARELGLAELGRFHEVRGGYAGVYGDLPTLTEFGDLLSRVREVTGVQDVHFVTNRRAVQRIAVLGGGTDAEGIREVEELDCHVLVTGTYYNLVQNEIGKRYRAEFDRIKDTLAINLVECSHYASEAIVMRKDMVELCAARFGIECEFVPQDDPWY